MEKLPKEHIELLWNKFLNNEASQEELQLLLSNIDGTAEGEGRFDFISAAIAAEQPGKAGFVPMDEEQKAAMIQKIKEHVSLESGSRMRPVYLIRRWWAAAAVILCCIIGGFFLFLRGDRSATEKIAVTPGPIVPGKEGAILTLSDGKQVVLDSLNNGLVADQDGTRISLENGKLGYDASAASEARYNKMTTPRGRQFHLQLPDGTSVWLNAASSITYPTAFTGKERTVFISGEAYFDIAKDAHKPFRVKVNDQLDVEVLGTEFNVNAYQDEKSIKTTLLEGKIRAVVEPLINNSSNRLIRKELILKPGQQITVSENQQVQLKDNADLNNVLAWRKGYFNFADADIPEVMRQLQRWYDIEIAYEGTIPNKVISGKMGRDLNLNDVLDILKQMKLNYRLEGRQLVIIP